jgi:hypothetical protein
MTTTADRSHLPSPRRRALQIAVPEALLPSVCPLTASKEFNMLFSSRWLFLTLLLTAGFSMPATAFDFLGDVVATKPRFWNPPNGTTLPEDCPSHDYIYHLDTGDAACRVHYGAPGQGAYTELCTVDLFDSRIMHNHDEVNCEEESLVANFSVLQQNLARNSPPMANLDRMLTEAPGSDMLEAMGFDGPLRLTSTAPTLDIQNTNDFYLTGADLEHRVYHGGKAVVWHEDPNLGLVQLATYDLVTLELELAYFTLESSIVVTAVRTSGLTIFPETWTGELTGPSFAHGVDAGVFPARLGMDLGMELGPVATPSLGRLGLLSVAGMLATAGWLGVRRSLGIKPRKPQLNGKVERSHRTDKDEFYQLLTYKDVVDIEKELAVLCERFCNFDRPHGGT